MRVFVTGGSGFIGSRVVDLLLANGFDVCSYDIAEPRKAAHLKLHRRGDLLDQDALSTAIAEFQPQYLVHLAARAEIQSTAWEAFSSIHEGTANLLRAVDRYGELERLVNVSTQLVIGPQYTPRSTLDFRPYTTYGEAKAYAESLLLQWQSSVQWFTVRPANIWGPEHPSFADAIWKYIGQGVYLHPAGDSPVMRSYGYVENTAEQLLALLLVSGDKTYRQVFYLADHVLDSSIWVDAFATALSGKRARRVPVAGLKALGTVGDIISKLGIKFPLDSGRAMRMTQSYPVPLDPTFAIAGAPRVSLEDGVASTVTWLQSRQAGDCTK